MFGVTSLAPCAMLLSKADTLICNLSAERFKFSNSGSLTRWLIYFGSLASVCSQLKRPQKSLIRSTSHPPVYLHCCSARIRETKRFRLLSLLFFKGFGRLYVCEPLRGANYLVGGTRCSPNPPEKPGQNVAVLSQKRDWKCVHFGLFYWQDQASFFSSLASKKWPSIRLIFPVFDPEK